jgi:hypothetical protein
MQRFVFKKGSRFVPMFNRAIDANKYLIERIIKMYLNFLPPSECNTQNIGPTPLCKLFDLKYDYSTCFLAMAPYYGLLILFFVGMSSACFVFSGELLKWTKFRK